MGRHVLTIQEKIKGTRQALLSPHTPEHLKPGLRRYLRTLQAKADEGSSRRRIRRRTRKEPKAGLFEWFRL